MKWEYFQPNFEFYDGTSGAWWGHVYFVYDLVRNIKPAKIVELGTCRGNSFFSMCQAVKDGNIETELHAVDTWKGEKHIGFYDESVCEKVQYKKHEFFSDLRIILHRKFFDEALCDFDDKSIDLLHIDGLHTYEAVQHDFETWLPKVKNQGVILFHDIHEKREDFGVYQLWSELKKEYKTFEFYHSHGLGVLFLDEGIYHKTMKTIDPDGLNGYYIAIYEIFLKKYKKNRKLAKRKFLLKKICPW
jgi:hypothetical protein